jgi:Ti-type conjugative transfer relaxase TraA
MIGFARMQMVQRSRGGSATHKSAYNGRDEVVDERTGRRHDYSNREAPVHHEVLLPEGSPAHFENVGLLWNAAEAAEGRKDSQVAREMVVALPADAEFTHRDRVALIRSFVQEHFVSKGLAVQLDIHAPEEGEADGTQANWHAHLLITTRRLGPDGLDPLKARDLDPVVRRIGGTGRVVEGDRWGELWRLHQERFCREQGYDLKVDPNGLVSEIHVGPYRMRRAMSEPALRLEALREANREATYDVGRVLEALTRYDATFTERDLDRLLVKQLDGDVEEISAVRTMVLASPDLAVLLDPDTGKPLGRFTTRQVRAEEQSVVDKADALVKRKTGAARAGNIRGVKGRVSLRPDQEAAFDYVTGAGHLKLIAGRAGTGKSYTLSAIRQAYESEDGQGQRVVGLAPTNAVAQAMKADGFSEAATLHSALFQLKNGQMQWGPDTVVMVDEAAMIATPILSELLGAADQAGAKLILCGDERQLASIERTGMFAELLQRQGFAEISQVTRQQVDWQREAAQNLAEYRFEKAVAAFEQAGAIDWSATRQDAHDALVAAWERDYAAWKRERDRWRQADPGEAEFAPESRFVFAYTNADVDALNAKLRVAWRAQGELSGPDVHLEVCYRAAEPGEEEELHRVAFSRGDRIQFTRTDKRAGIHNSDVGTITELNSRTGEICARLDTADGRGRIVHWNAHRFNGFRHGYAGTIYKGQGKTLDRTYLYHSRHWTAASSYVALTRQRKSAEIFVSRQTAGDVQQLARQMARSEGRLASLAWPTQGATDSATPGYEWQAKEEAVPIKREEGDGADGREVDVKEGLETHREKQRHSVERIQTRGQVRRLLQDWNERITALRAAQPDKVHAPARYEEARARLMEFARPLNDRPALVALLNQAALALDTVEPATLLTILNHTDPSLALRQMIDEAQYHADGHLRDDTQPEPRRHLSNSRDRSLIR